MASRRVHERNVIWAAARHATRLAEQGDPGLTEYGIASCAASLALVLTDETHPNHDRAVEQHHIADLDLYSVFRPDGWPLCPTCGEDELWSNTVPAEIHTIAGCYRCPYRPSLEYRTERAAP